MPLHETLYIPLSAVLQGEGLAALGMSSTC